MADGEDFVRNCALEDRVKDLKKGKNEKEIHTLLNGYTSDICGSTVVRWKEMEEKFWSMFGLGF